MTLRDYVIVMGIGTAAAWLAFAVVVVSIDPVRAGWLGLAFFYLTLGLSAIGTLSIGGAAVRVRVHPGDMPSRQVAMAFRQAVLLSVLLIVSLVLLSAGFFRFWTAILLVLAFATVELAFLSSQRHRPPSV